MNENDSSEFDLPHIHRNPLGLPDPKGHVDANGGGRLNGFPMPYETGLNEPAFDALTNPEEDQHSEWAPPGSAENALKPAIDNVDPIGAMTLEAAAKGVGGDPQQTPRIEEETPAGQGLPSAGFVTPAKLAYYSRLAEAPRLDRDFIAAEARTGATTLGEGEVRVMQHHRHLCQMARAGLRHTLEEKRNSLTRNLGYLDDDIRRTRRLLASTRQFDDVPGAQPTLQWTFFDRLAAVGQMAFAVAGIGVDFFTWATILKAVDPLFYHHPEMVLCYGAVPLALPFSIKLLLSRATDEHGEDRGLRRLAWLGIFCCLLAITLFSFSHDGPAGSGATGFGSLHAGATRVSGVIDVQRIGEKATGVFLMLSAAVCSAGFAHLFHGMFKRRRRAARVPNPQFGVTAKRLTVLQAASHEERETLGAVNGKMQELEAEESALIGSAVNFYRELRTIYTHSEQRLAGLLDPSGDAARSNVGNRKLKKGGQTLGLILLAAATMLGVGGCGRSGAADNGGGAGGEKGSSGSMAAHVVFGLSPRLDEAERERVYTVAGELAVRDLPAGGSFEAWDAYALRRVCAFQIPRDNFYGDNPRARQQIAAGAMAELQNWLAQTPADGGTVASPGILLPQFVEIVSRQAKSPGERTAVLLAGSAMYVHPRDTAWNTVGNVFYTDGHLHADPELTPFSVRRREQALSGVTLHFAYLRDEWASEAQRQGLMRFYALWTKSQQGCLATFSQDLAVALDDLRRGGSAPVLDPVPNPSEEKPELREVRVERPALGVRNTVVPAASSLLETADTDWIVSSLSESERRGTRPPASPLIQKLAIGIKWSAPVDVDLYAAPRAGAAELYYGRPQTPEGRHLKDWQEAPVGVNGFETIEFAGPTDLRRVTAALNLYKGTAPQGVDVTVRVLADGRRYERLCHLAASEGNRGANSSRRDSDRHWVILNPAEICGIRD